MNREFIIILVGLLLTITIVGAIVGLPLIAIGAYLLNKKVDNPTEEIQQEIIKKEKELDNIDETLSKMEADKKAELEKLEEEKTIEIENNLKHKQEELDNIDETLDKLERERTELIDTKLKSRKEELATLDEKYNKLTEEKEKELYYTLKEKELEIDSAEKKLKELNKDIVYAEELGYLQEYGLYEPRYDFIDSVSYKERLDKIRQEQKNMVKSKRAAVCNTEWEVGGNKRKGQAMTNDNIKQIIRTFNIECDSIINKVTYSNIENSEKRIRKSFEQLNKLNKRVDVTLTNRYLNLKIEELYLAHEYKMKKEEEKELLREAREREREEKKLQKELEKEKKKFDKENTKITSEIDEVKQQLANAAAEEKAKLEAEIAKLQAALDKNNEEIEKIDKYRETPGAGYVYIISNVGSFGEDVFKIGVTRRDNPEDRIRELSSASVPFRFDSHVFIFSDKAYDLESSLHERFDKQRVNKVNRRKEFFRISMDDVKQIVEENKGAVHSFVERPDNEEYFDTLKIEKSMK